MVDLFLGKHFSTDCYITICTLDCCWKIGHLNTILDLTENPTAYIYICKCFLENKNFTNIIRGLQKNPKLKKKKKKCPMTPIRNGLTQQSSLLVCLFLFVSFLTVWLPLLLAWRQSPTEIKRTKMLLKHFASTETQSASGHTGNFICKNLCRSPVVSGHELNLLKDKRALTQKKK